MALSLEALRRIYRVSQRAELAFVDRLPERPSRIQLAHAWRLADRTNAALRAIQAHPEYCEGSAIHVVA